MKRLSLSLLGMCLLFLATGCSGGSGKATVKGTVQYKNKPVTGGNVTFHFADNSTYTARILGDGTFIVTDVPFGAVKATVTPMPKGMMAPKAPPKDTPAMPTSPTDPKYMDLPAKYSKVETANLSYTIEKRDQTIEITLAD